MGLRKGDRGQRVIALQHALIHLGESLPRFGADGSLGGETLDALASFLNKRGRTDDDPSEITDEELLFVMTQDDMLHRARIPRLEKLVDRRASAGRSKDMGARPWSEVRGWCLHQTACWLSASSQTDRCDDIGAHWVVYPDGTKFLLHDATRKIVHGNGFNNQTIGIEIDGLFAGVEGRRDTVWDNPETRRVEQAGSVTPAQVLAVMDIVRHDHALITAHGGRATAMVAHRQSSKSRRNDPGSKVWKEIALPLMAELGLSDGGQGFEIGGYPIPREWDDNRVEKY